MVVLSIQFDEDYVSNLSSHFHQKGQKQNSEFKMAAKAVFSCRPNSHPFQERTLTLDQSVKIGRSVARVRPAPNNAIFDCKVLSRNHALLWYDNGKFYLQDTKSSNGTFVNNQRLSKGSEESAPREVCSGDIVQFGVDVMENSRKVTHGCIVATLKLYLPDGKEAKASPTTSVTSTGSIPLQDLYQLHQYLQEALHREQTLETKLSMVQHLVKNTKEAAEQGWKALIDEDRLLTRIEVLESQLQTYSKNMTDDKLREEVRMLQEDKDKYQETSKVKLLKMLQEKLEVVNKLKDVEQALTNTDDECTSLKEMCEKNHMELQELGVKYTSEQERVEELIQKLKDAEEKHKEELDKLEQEKKELEYKLEDRIEKGEKTQLKIDVEDSKKEEVGTDDDQDEKEVDGMSTILVTRKDRNLKVIVELQKKIGVLEEELEKSRSMSTTFDEEDNPDSTVIQMNGSIRSALTDLTSSDAVDELHNQLVQMKDVCEKTELKCSTSEEQTARLLSELDSANSNLKSALDEASSLRKELDSIIGKIKVKDEEEADLQEQIQQLQESLTDAERKIVLFHSQLDEEKCRQKASAMEADALRRHLASLKKDQSGQGDAKPMYCAECSRVQSLTNDDVVKLREQFSGASEQDLITEIQQLCVRLNNAEGLMLILKEKYAACNGEKTRLQQDLKGVQESLTSLQQQSQTTMLCYVVPLLIVFLAVLVVYHPSS